MKLLIYCTLIFSFTLAAQNDTIIITSRENVPLQAVLDVASSKVLYAGQEYTFVVTTSGQYDLRLMAKNASVHLIEDSKKSTGGLYYSVTPIDTGECSITIGNVVDDKRSFSLKMQAYKVINYPIPPITIERRLSGQVITEMNDSMVIQCAYSKETGIYDSYEVKSWVATVGEKNFSGNNNFFTEELIQYIREVKTSYLYLKVILTENKTGHLNSEGIYFIRLNEETKK